MPNAVEKTNRTGEPVKDARNITKLAKRSLLWGGKILFPAGLLFTTAFFGREFFDATFQMPDRVRAEAAQKYPLDYSRQDLVDSKTLIADYHKTSDKLIENGANTLDISQFNKSSTLTLQRALLIADTDEVRTDYYLKNYNGQSLSIKDGAIFWSEQAGVALLGLTSAVGTLVLDVSPHLPIPDKRKYY